MKLIRLWGIIAFFVVTLVAAGIFYWIAPSVIESSIEEIGSEALGAQVDIDQVELALFPLRVEIDRLQATDPDQPMKNIFEAKKINFALDSNALLWKKVLIDELTITGVQTGSDRATSGQLKTGRKTEQLSRQVSAISLPEFGEKEVKEAVAKADLITLKRLDKLNNNKGELEKYWKSALDKKANKKRLDKLQTEFDRLKKRAKDNKMNLLTDRKAWKRLKKDIDKERQHLKDLNSKLKSDQNDLRQQIALVKQGPKDDLDAIMGKMGLGNGIAGLSDKFLGPEFTPWVEKAIAITQGMGGQSADDEQDLAYSTDKGKRVIFKDDQIFPDVLIKKINLSGKDKNWSIEGLGKDVGYFPWLTGKPATLNLNLAGNGNAKMSIISDWQSEKKMSTSIDSKVDHWNIQNLKLMQTEQGDWWVNSGKLDATLKGKMTLEKIDLSLSVNLKSPNIKVPEKLSGWQKTLAASINQQKQLNVKVAATGSLSNPKLKVSSSLEKLFSKAIGAKLKEKTDKLKGKFSKALSEKIGDLSSLDKISGSLDQYTTQLKGNDELLKKLRGGI